MTEHTIRTPKRPYILIIPLLWLTTWLLFHNLDTLSLSVDEFINVEIDTLPVGNILTTLKQGKDLHPPMQHWLSHAWLTIFSVNEWHVRAVWAFFSLLTVAFVYRLGKKGANNFPGIIAGLLLATSSTFLLYSRFVKYYALTMFLAAALFLIFWNLARKFTWPRYFLYILALADCRKKNFGTQMTQISLIF